MTKATQVNNEENLHSCVSMLALIDFFQGVPCHAWRFVFADGIGLSTHLLRSFCFLAHYVGGAHCPPDCQITSTLNEKVQICGDH